MGTVTPLSRDEVALLGTSQEGNSMPGHMRPHHSSLWIEAQRGKLGPGAIDTEKLKMCQQSLSPLDLGISFRSGNCNGRPAWRTWVSQMWHWQKDRFSRWHSSVPDALVKELPRLIGFALCWWLWGSGTSGSWPSPGRYTILSNTTFSRHPLFQA